MPIHYDISRVEPDLSEATAFIAEAKRLARHYREMWARRSIELGHSECLELVSMRHGARDWNTLHASLKDGGILRQAPNGYQKVLNRIFGLSINYTPEIGDRLLPALKAAMRIEDESNMWWQRMQDLMLPVTVRLVRQRSYGRSLNFSDFAGALTAFGQSGDTRDTAYDLVWGRYAQDQEGSFMMREWLRTLPGMPADWRPGEAVPESAMKQMDYLTTPLLAGLKELEREPRSNARV